MGYKLKVVHLGPPDIPGILKKKIVELRAIFDQIAKDAAADARSTHRYINRTGNLEGSTVGGREVVGQVVRVSGRDEPASYMEEGMYYASYVRSLSGFDKAVARAKAEFDIRLAQWCDEVSELVGFRVSVTRQDLE